MSNQIATTPTDDVPLALAVGNPIREYTTGRRPIKWDMVYPRAEALAAKGHKTATAVLHCLGIHPSTLSRQDKAIQEKFLTCIEKGQAAWADKLLELAAERIPKNDILLMFALKQEHGAGWSDQAVNVLHGGKMEIVVTHRVMGAEEQAPLDITAESKAVEDDS